MSRGAISRETELRLTEYMMIAPRVAPRNVQNCYWRPSNSFGRMHVGDIRHHFHCGDGRKENQYLK
jgi:hypothetical protein